MGKVPLDLASNNGCWVSFWFLFQYQPEGGPQFRTSMCATFMWVPMLPCFPRTIRYVAFPGAITARGTSPWLPSWLVKSLLQGLITIPANPKKTGASTSAHTNTPALAVSAFSALPRKHVYSPLHKHTTRTKVPGKPVPLKRTSCQAWMRQICGSIPGKKRSSKQMVASGICSKPPVRENNQEAKGMVPRLRFALGPFPNTSVYQGLKKSPSFSLGFAGCASCARQEFSLLQNPLLKTENS